jgi:hypothetical protein
VAVHGFIAFLMCLSSYTLGVSSACIDMHPPALVR